MAYDGKVMREALQRFEEDKQRRASQTEARRQRIYREIPRLEAIEKELRGTVARIMTEALRHGEDPAPALLRIRTENAMLQQERAELLAEHGYAPDALEDKPRCALCGDTGYCGGKMCACLQKYYAQEQIRSLSSLLDVGSQSFDTFGLEWYDTKVGAQSRSPRETMERNLATCQTFAAEFGKKPENLLLFGDPGLGKTFLSACIARVVSEKGYSVVYDTASNVFARFEARKFIRFGEDARQAGADTRRYLTCDLLILDDLGSEFTSPFTQAALYEVINTRLVENKHTVISSNLSLDAIRQRYSAQVASRLEGMYQTLVFFGQDIRMLKKQQR